MILAYALLILTDLARYSHNEDLGQLETKAQTQLNSQSITKG